jgi:siderophore synthetase component
MFSARGCRRTSIARRALNSRRRGQELCETFFFRQATTVERKDSGAGDYWIRLAAHVRKSRLSGLWGEPLDLARGSRREAAGITPDMNDLAKDSEQARQRAARARQRAARARQRAELARQRARMHQARAEELLRRELGDPARAEHARDAAEAGERAAKESEHQAKESARLAHKHAADNFKQRADDLSRLDNQAAAAQARARAAEAGSPEA